MSTRSAVEPVHRRTTPSIGAPCGESRPRRSRGRASARLRRGVAVDRSRWCVNSTARPADQHAVAAQVRTRRPGEHHAGPVVVGERDRAARRPRWRARPRRPGSARPARGPSTVERRTRGAGCGAARRARSCRRRCRPRWSGRGSARPESGSARQGRSSIRMTRRPAAAAAAAAAHAGRAAADHQHVAVRVHGVVRGPGPASRPASPARAATTPRSPSKSSTVVAVSIGSGNGVSTWTTRGRLLGAGGDDAARTAEVDAGRDLAHAVGEQRRGERVAGVAGELATVEAERQRPAAVDRAAEAGVAVRLASCRRPDLVGHRVAGQR